MQTVLRKITLQDDFLRLSLTETKGNTSPWQSLRTEVFFSPNEVNIAPRSSCQPKDSRVFLDDIVYLWELGLLIVPWSQWVSSNWDMGLYKGACYRLSWNWSSMMEIPTKQSTNEIRWHCMDEGRVDVPGPSSQLRNYRTTLGHSGRRWSFSRRRPHHLLGGFSSVQPRVYFSFPVVRLLLLPRLFVAICSEENS